MPRWMTLGYLGRTNRRDFTAGVALSLIGPYALSLAIRGSIDRLFSTFPKVVALMLAILLTAIVCAAIVAWFWGWSVLLTRRARDIGLPAWAGLASAFVLGLTMTGVKGFMPRDLYDWTNFLACAAFALAWAIWPSRGEPVAPRRQSPVAPAATALARSSTVP